MEPGGAAQAGTEAEAEAATEKHRAAAYVEDPRPPPTPGVTPVLQRWRQEDLLEKGRLALRSLGCLFSLLSFVIMAANRHGDWREFDRYQEFRYVVGVGVLAFLYSLVQVVLQGVRLNGRFMDLCSARTSTVLDFAGDQVASYFLISALSSAIPLTNRMRAGGDNIFTDSLSASVSMAFFAFLALALSSMISGYKLSKLSYI